MSTSADESGLREAKRIALETLESNEAQQQKLREFIAKLKAGIDDVDALINEVEEFSAKCPEAVEMDEAELPKTIQVKGAVRYRIPTGLPDPDSPMYEAAVAREKYLEKIKIRTWTPADRQILKCVVIAEQKRNYALELQNSGQPDVLDAVQANPDEHYENMDATELDWEKVASKVDILLPYSTSSRTPADCKVQWLGSDQPKITKGPWSAHELSALKKAANECIIPPEELDDPMENQAPGEPVIDWLLVSEKLGGSRVAADCLRQWLKHDFGERIPSEPPAAEAEADAVPGPSTTSGEAGSNSTAQLVISNEEYLKKKKKEGTAWTEEEDQALLDLVTLHGRNNWSLVATMLPYPRSARQCSDRYRNSVDPSIRRAKWTRTEDENLAKAVAELGPKWSKVRQFVPGRTGAQCRERWVNRVDPTIRRTEFTEEEDAKIMELRGKGLDWPEIAAEIGGRTDNQCWRRWKALQKEKHFMNKGKEKAPAESEPLPSPEEPATPEIDMTRIEDDPLEQINEENEEPEQPPKPQLSKKSTPTQPPDPPAETSRPGKRKRQSKTPAHEHEAEDSSRTVPISVVQSTRSYSLRKRTRVNYAAQDDEREELPEPRSMRRNGKGTNSKGRGKGKRVERKVVEEEEEEDEYLEPPRAERAESESSLSSAPPSP